MNLARLTRKNEAGAELVELAIVFPILFLLLLGIVDFAFLFQRWQVVTNATREGARLASVRTPDYTEQDIEDRVQSYLDANGLQATPTIDVDFATSETINAVTTSTVTVIVTYPSAFLFLPGSINLGSTSEMRSEGGF